MINCFVKIVVDLEAVAIVIVASPEVAVTENGVIVADLEAAAIGEIDLSVRTDLVAGIAMSGLNGQRDSIAMNGLTIQGADVTANSS